ncbi:MAG: DUF4276 family protein [Planctomycetota bacterium]
MVRVKLYIEGGGDRSSLHTECRRGFRKLFENAGFKRMPSTKACGSRDSAFDDFQTACAVASAEDYPILLVDSEAPVADKPWKHLKKRDKWEKPQNADDDQAQLVVQCMETWCVADRKALGDFFGQHLQKSALPKLNDLERQAKDDIQNKLNNATRKCGKGREYKKGKRSFELLTKLDPNVLKEHLPHFKTLCKVLANKLSS